MNDEEYFEQLCSNSVDGTLTDSEREKLEAHLAECPSCAALKRDLEEMRALFACEEEPPATLHDSIMQRVREEEKKRFVQPVKPMRRLPALSMVAAAAAVVLVVLGGGLGGVFGMVNMGGGSNSSSAASADAAAAVMDEAVTGAASDAGLDTGGADGAAKQAIGEDAAGEVDPAEQADDRSTIAGRDASAPEIAESAAAPDVVTAYTAEHVGVPEKLQGASVAHCYVAYGAGELPELGGALAAQEGNATYILLDNSMEVIQNTFKALEDAGYAVQAEDAPGLTIDSKADSWLLIVEHGVQ